MDKHKIMQLAGNKFITVTFIKNNGEIRTINGRLGVKIGVKYTGKRMPSNILTIWECKNKNFRNITISSIKEINASGYKLTPRV